MNENVNKFHLS